jgi:hypothetical protein
MAAGFCFKARALLMIQRLNNFLPKFLNIGEKDIRSLLHKESFLKKQWTKVMPPCCG